MAYEEIVKSNGLYILPVAAIVFIKGAALLNGH